MKKIIVLSVLTVFTFSCYAQARFGIFAGPQASTVKYTITDVKQPTDHKYGFQAGFGWKIPFETNLFFTPTAFYSLKGYKVTFNRYAHPPDTSATDNNTTIHTFELAALLQFDMGKKPSHFFIKAGPSLDFQLAGKEKYNLKTGGSVDRNMLYTFADYGHFCANLLLQLGYETSGGFMFFAQYSYGLVNLNNADDGPRINYRVIGISIGKYFNKKRSS